MRRGLLEGLQEGVPSLGGEHVGLVDDVHLAAQRRGQVLDLLAEIAHLVDAAVAGGVDLQDIHRAAFDDLNACAAAVAGFAVLEVEAVDGARQDPGGRRLAGAPNPGEEVGVGQGVRADLVAQRCPDHVLADQVGEARRSIAAVQRGGHPVRVAWPRAPPPASPRPHPGARIASPGGAEGSRAPHVVDVTPALTRSSSSDQVGYGTPGGPLTAASFRT